MMIDSLHEERRIVLSRRNAPYSRDVQERRVRVVNLVRSRPGMTAPEIAKEFRLSRDVMRSTLYRIERTRQLIPVRAGRDVYYHVKGAEKAARAYFYRDLGPLLAAVRDGAETIGTLCEARQSTTASVRYAVERAENVGFLTSTPQAPYGKRYHLTAEGLEQANAYGTLSDPRLAVVLPCKACGTPRTVESRGWCRHLCSACIAARRACRYASDAAVERAALSEADSWTWGAIRIAEGRLHPLT